MRLNKVFVGIYYSYLQVWYYTKSNEIRKDDACLDYPGGKAGLNQPNKILTFSCHGSAGNQEWNYTNVNK